MSEADRLHPPLLSLCKDLPPRPGGLTVAVQRHFTSFKRQNSTWHLHLPATRMQYTTSNSFSLTPKLNECSLYLEIELLWVCVEDPEMLTCLRLVTVWTDEGVKDLCKGCSVLNADWRTTEENSDWTLCRLIIWYHIHTDMLTGEDWALLLSPEWEGLATCSRVEMNWLLIQSKCNGSLPSIYQIVLFICH